MMLTHLTDWSLRCDDECTGDTDLAWSDRHGRNLGGGLGYLRVDDVKTVLVEAIRSAKLVP
jgi:hypothetical protein